MPLPLGDLSSRRCSPRADRPDARRLRLATSPSATGGVRLPIEAIIASSARCRAHHRHEQHPRAGSRAARSRLTPGAELLRRQLPTSGSARRRAPASCTYGASIRTASRGPIVSWGHSEEPSTFISAQRRSRARANPCRLPHRAGCDQRSSRSTGGTTCVGARAVSRCAARRAATSVSYSAPSRSRRRRWLLQLASVRLPDGVNGEALARTLWEEGPLEIPVGCAAKDLLRISIAAYTTQDDVDRLLAALPRVLATA